MAYCVKKKDKIGMSKTQMYSSIWISYDLLSSVICPGCGEFLSEQILGGRWHWGSDCATMKHFLQWWKLCASAVFHSASKQKTKWLQSQSKPLSLENFTHDRCQSNFNSSDWTVTSLQCCWLWSDTFKYPGIAPRVRITRNHTFFNHFSQQIT